MVSNMHTCPHCQKPIAIKLDVKLMTQAEIMDSIIEKKGE